MIQQQNSQIHDSKSQNLDKILNFLFLEKPWSLALDTNRGPDFPLPPGYYCPAGSIGPTQNACPAASYREDPGGTPLVLLYLGGGGGQL